MLAGLIIALLPESDDVHLKVMPKGAMTVMGGYMPQRLQLSDERPDGLLRSSAIGMVEFGTLKFGPKGSKQSHFIAVGSDGALYIDANGNGDLSDDPEVEWKGSAYKGSDGEQYTIRRGSFSVDLKMRGSAVLVRPAAPSSPILSSSNRDKVGAVLISGGIGAVFLK